MLKLWVSLQNSAAQLREQEEGQAMAEYALIIALVAVLLVGTLTLFKDEIVGVFTDINNAL